MQLWALRKPTKRNFDSLFNWIWENKPIGPTDESLFFRRKDFVSLVGVEEDSWFDDLVERLLIKLPGKIGQNIFASSEQRAKTADHRVRFYDNSRLDTLIKIVVAFLSVALLMIPVWLLFVVKMSHTVMTVIVLLFVFVFAAVLSLFTTAKRQEVFFGAAAYCAVLVVFLGNLNSQPQ
jgi:uncharacterized membrane protein